MLLTTVSLLISLRNIWSIKAGFVSEFPGEFCVSETVEWDMVDPYQHAVIYNRVRQV